MGKYIKSDGNGSYIIDKQTFRWFIGTFITLAILFTSFFAQVVQAQNQIETLHNSVEDLKPRLRNVENTVGVLNERLESIDKNIEKIDRKTDTLIDKYIEK